MENGGSSHAGRGPRDKAEADPYGVSDNVDREARGERCGGRSPRVPPASSDCRRPGKCDCNLETVLSDCDRAHSCEENEDVEIAIVENGGGVRFNIGADPDLPGPSRSDRRINSDSPNRQTFNPQKNGEPEDSSSDTGNDDYSIGSEDGCIYTYRGGDRASDRPDPFGAPANGEPLPPRLADELPPIENGGNHSRASSPEMDFLEMDFDPGPSCEMDSDGESGPDVDLENVDAEASRERETVNGDGGAFAIDVDGERFGPSSSKTGRDLKERESESNSNPEGNRPEIVAGPSARRSSEDGFFDFGDFADDFASGSRPPTSNGVGMCGSLIPHATVGGEVIYVRKTSFSWPAREVPAHLGSGGDLVPAGDALDDCYESTWSRARGSRRTSRDPESPGSLEASRNNLSSTLFHSYMAKKLVVVDSLQADFLSNRDTSNEDGGDASDSEGPPAFPKRMIWSEREACSRQVTQIGTSACGATAVINALLALNQTVDASAMERVTAAIGTRQRANGAPLCRYLRSRSVAGCGVEALAAGLEAGSNGAVRSRFFPTWPERCVSLTHWLAYWIELGAVPIATLNLQSGMVNPTKIPDSWHHQMIFGVGPRGIYMVNPLECVEEGALWHQLCSDSVLLIQQKDIMNRWNPRTDLSSLMDFTGETRWETMNVLGQVVNMIRGPQCRVSHIKIPACYRAGVTVAALVGSEAHERLLRAPELPFLASD